VGKKLADTFDGTLGFYPMTAEEWAICTEPRIMLAFLGESISPRKRMLFASACCDRIRDLMEPRSRSALAAVRLAADGRMTPKEMEWELGEASKAKGDAFRAACIPVMGIERYERISRMLRTGIHEPEIITDACPVTNAAFAAEHAVETVFVPSKVALAAEAAARAVARRMKDSQEEKAEQAAQATILRDLIGNPFQPFLVESSWLTPTVTSLAQAAYDERTLSNGELNADRLAVLSDALEEAGCNERAILEHLRGSAPHVRGCFAIDSLLKKA